MFNFKKKQNIIKKNTLNPPQTDYSFIDDETKNNIHIIINKAKNIITNELLPIIKKLNEPLEGNIFMLHNTTEYTDKYIDKQINFILASKRKNINSVLEIGFNAGFSTLLILLSNENIKITCVDICEHSYTKHCFNKLRNIFGNRIELISGSSVDILPTLIGNTYDLIHIDGCHLVNIAELDIQNSFKLSKSGTILIMDDTDYKPLYNLWMKYVINFKLLTFYPGNFVKTIYHDLKVFN